MELRYVGERNSMPNRAGVALNVQGFVVAIRSMWWKTAQGRGGDS